MALYYGKKQISGGRDYKTEHQMEDYSVSFVDDGEGYTDAAAALSEINSGSKFGKLFAAIKGCLMKFLSSISSLSSDLTALQNKATELQNTVTELEKKATELQEKTTTLENGLTSCNSDLSNKVSKSGDTMTAALNFNNLSGFHAICKYRDIGDLTYRVLYGLGSSGTTGSGAIELAASDDSYATIKARLDVYSDGRVGYRYNNSGTYELFGQHNLNKIILNKIQLNDGVNNRTVMQIFDDGDSYDYGSELVIGAAGNTYIGSGESATNLYNANGVSTSENMFISSDGNIYFYCNCQTIANRKAVILSNSALYPATSGGFTLGTSSLKWGQIYSTASTISTSDANRKHDINDLGSKSIDFILQLQPKSYKYNDGTSNRKHWGLIAQDVENTLSVLNIPSSDFAGFIKSPKEKLKDKNSGEFELDLDESGNIQYEYGLRYEEFIAPLIMTIQKQQQQINRLYEVLNLTKY